jgi:hypothetical protein
MRCFISARQHANLMRVNRDSFSGLCSEGAPAVRSSPASIRPSSSTAKRLQLRTFAAPNFQPSSDRERRHEPLDPAPADGPQVVLLYVQLFL